MIFTLHKICLFLLFIILSFNFLNCSGQTNERYLEKAPNYIPSKQSLLALDECVEEKEGEIYFVHEISGLIVCTDLKEWEPIGATKSDGDSASNKASISTGNNPAGSVAGSVGQTALNMGASSYADCLKTSGFRRVWCENILKIARISAKYSSSDNGCIERVSLTGTAFVVRNNLLVSNSHVIKKSFKLGTCLYKRTEVVLKYPSSFKGSSAKSAEITVADIDNQFGSPYDDQGGLVVGGSHKNDLVLLYSDTADRGFLSLNPDDPKGDFLFGKGLKLNDQVLLIGFSDSTQYAWFSQGAVLVIEDNEDIKLNQFSWVENNTFVFQYNLVSAGGASGGPVLDFYGKVVGINFAEKACSKETLITRGKDCEYMVGFGLQVKHLRDLLCKKRLWEKVKEGDIGAFPADNIGHDDQTCKQ